MLKKSRYHNCLSESMIRGIVADAISNERYNIAIRRLSPHIACLTDKRKYSLALLCDHQARRMRTPRMHSGRLRHLKMAKRLYRKVLYKNPRDVLAWLGMGRVEILKGNFSNALIFEKKAYYYLASLPRRERGALGIGQLYEELGRMKLAERWYVKELRICSPNDFGTALNIFRFYLRNGPNRKAKTWAMRIEQLVAKEFLKPQYQGLKMVHSKFVKDIKKDVRSVLR